MRIGRGIAIERRAFVVCGVGVLLVLAGSTGQSGWLFVMAGGVLGLVGSAPFISRSLPRVEVVRSAPTRIVVGDRAPVRFSLVNPDDRPVPASRLEDSSEGLDPVAFYVPALVPGTHAEVSCDRTATRRGIYRAGEAVLRTAAPLGFITRSRPVVIAGDLVVVPRAHSLARVGFLAEDIAAEPAELGRGSRSGHGLETMGVREHRAGDPRRLVHWRSSAKTGRLVVRELEEEARPVLLLLVVPPPDADPSASFEQAVEAAASVGVHAIRSGMHVRAFLGSAAPLHDPSVDTLLLALAALGPAGSGTHVPRPAVPQGAVAAVFSSSRDLHAASVAAAHVASAGARSTLVIATASSWEEPTPSPDHGDALRAACPAGARLLRLTRDEDLVRCLAG